MQGPGKHETFRSIILQDRSGAFPRIFIYPPPHSFHRNINCPTSRSSTVESEVNQASTPFFVAIASKTFSAPARTRIENSTFSLLVLMSLLYPPGGFPFLRQQRLFVEVNVVVIYQSGWASNALFFVIARLRQKPWLRTIPSSEAFVQRVECSRVALGPNRKLRYADFHPCIPKKEFDGLFFFFA